MKILTGDYLIVSGLIFFTPFHPFPYLSTPFHTFPYLSIPIRSFQALSIPSISIYFINFINMKIVVLDGYVLNPGDLSWDGFERLGELTVYERTPASEVIKRSVGAEVLITNKTVLDSNVLNVLADLKYIGVLATGYNVVDIEEAKRKGITVTNVPAYSTDSVAQLTFALLLDLTLHVKEQSKGVHDGRWVASKDFSYRDFQLIELSGKTLGIIGFGSIGQKVADIANSFGMNVLSYSRTKTDQSHRQYFKWVSIEELFRQSDVISIHAPLVEATKGLVNLENLQMMKKTAYLINTSRGPVVNESDLAYALNEGMLAGAGLDVLSTEPPQSDNPLLTAKNCIITPHIAWSTFEARQRLMDIAVNNLASWLDGKPVNVVS
jgi:glycerate dehydrogenase